EHLLLYHHQRALALKMIAKEWFRNPLSMQPGRVFLRRFLPTPVVGRVVKWKNRSRQDRFQVPDPLKRPNVPSGTS
ncbi:MAG TPA: hypothetical protein VFP47_10990, partial [Pyrinomonadaceae bacterium]|nr:hypothetical protein [Pyrinomonadaceae bacterium]